MTSDKVTESINGIKDSIDELLHGVSPSVRVMVAYNDLTKAVESFRAAIVSSCEHKRAYH